LAASASATAFVSVLALSPLQAVPRAALPSRLGPVAEPRLQFEVASVKANTTGGIRVVTGATSRGGQFTVINAPLREIIRVAYGPRQPQEIVGGPDWIDSARFDIQARAGKEITPSEAFRMLRSLLEDDFELRTHEETRRLPVFSLVVAPGRERGDSRLTRSDVDCDAAARRGDRSLFEAAVDGRIRCGGRATSGAITAGAMDMKTFARLLSGFSGRIVQDGTKLSGGFDFRLEWTPDIVAPAENAAPADRPDAGGVSLFTAVQEQLGLKLTPGNGPVNVLVIDAVRRPNLTETTRLLPTSAAVITQASATESLPAFAVASVKENRALAGERGLGFPTGSRFAASNSTLRSLIGWAFATTVPLADQQIVGGPDWMDSTRFDVDARTDGDVPPERRRLMLRRLLVERFRLVARQEQRELPVYALVISGPGGTPRMGLAASDGSDCTKPGEVSADRTMRQCGSVSFFGARGAGRAVSMDTVALQLTRTPSVGRIVLNRTGLPGTFSFDFEFAPSSLAADPAASSPTGPSIFTALQESLGLRLDPTRAPVDVLVVESATRPVPD
jgi:uncharacterized protein (TIGR03435 family)